jgi:hypothetical protein
MIPAAAYRTRCAARAFMGVARLRRTAEPYTMAGRSIVPLAVAGHIWHEMRKEQAMAAL